MAADPRVPLELTNFLERKSGLCPLPIVDAGSEVAVAAKLFDEKGFVVVRGAICGETLEQIQSASKEVISEVAWYDPQCLGTRGSRRYSFASLSATKNQLHRPEWARLIDVPAITAILVEIWKSKDYACYGGGGDFCLPGALEHQFLHSDVGSCKLEAKVAPWISVNYFIDPQTPFNGPMRIIPGTQHSCMWNAPRPCDEPLDMLLSTISPVDAGAALMRDLRCWHGGTPNISLATRSLPSVEYVAPSLVHEHWFDEILPHRLWRKLSPHGRHVSWYISAPPGKELKVQTRMRLGRNRVTAELTPKFKTLKPLFAKKAKRAHRR
jgi:ectoine hydroxylase-related dioxygenase (phytanoyl-CoA dioxygenase family)